MQTEKGESSGVRAAAAGIQHAARVGKAQSGDKGSIGAEVVCAGVAGNVGQPHTGMAWGNESSGRCKAKGNGKAGIRGRGKGGVAGGEGGGKGVGAGQVEGGGQGVWGSGVGEGCKGARWGWGVAEGWGLGE